MRQFLRFVVDCSLKGELELLKESVIGVEVFGRAPSYDPRIEPIVRVEARRLREKLQEYYEGQGSQDSVVIHLPKGGYAPTFEIRSPAIPSSHQQSVDIPASSVVTAPSPPAASGGRWVLWSGVAAALCLAAVAMLRQNPNPPPVPSLVPLTSLPGYAFRPSISPDGKRVAFVWDGGSDNFDIYVKLINTGDPLRLTTNPEPDTDPAWSPDGSRIAFQRTSPERDEILVVSALGGAERKIAVRAPQVSGRLNLGSALLRRTGPVWSPDGRQIAMVDSSGDESDAIYLVTVDTGERRRLTTPARRDESDSDPSFSPQGDRVAFVRWRAGAAGSGDLYVQSVNGGEPKQLTFDHRQMSGLTWTPDGRRIIFASDRNGDYRLWHVALAGGAPMPVAGGERGARHPSLSPDGKRLAFTEQVFSTRIWRVPLGSTEARTSEPFTVSSRRDDSPMYSPDGKRVAFVSDRAGPSEIWVCDARGANASPVASLGGFVPGTPRWSPNSADIVFDSRHEGFGGVYVVSADGGRPRRLTPESSNSMMPSWSSDGRFVYFASDRSGSWQVWKQLASGGAAVQITRKGGREAKESPDGRFVYYGGLGPVGLWKVSPSGGDETAMPEFEKVRHWRYWTVTNRGIYYLSSDREPWTISFFDFKTGLTKPVLTNAGKPVLGTPGLTVSPDGQSLLYSQVNREGSDIMMLENFE
jgi:Tol biopolymer transport system component